jgi:predicted Zn-dependent peptidase
MDIRPVNGTHEIFSYGDGASSTSDVFFGYHHRYRITPERETMFELMAQIVESELFEQLRERLGLIYNLYVDHRFFPLPVPYSEFVVETSCDPHQSERIADRFHTILERLKTTPVSEKDLNNAVKTIEKNRATYRANTNYWRSRMEDYVLAGIDLNRLEEGDDILKTVTPEKVREAFVKYFDTSNSFTLYIHP